jgi:ABC-type polysaccharide/polyol phosphate transport system ATPase subunit
LLSGSEPAVEVEDLSLRYKTTSDRKPTLKGHLGRFRRHKTKFQVEALHEVSFEVPLGCVYGVIGRNGAGKSTLLRAIAGILPPSEGQIRIYRRVTLLLSLGLGFNRELTGRENILLGGLAAGLDEDEVKRHEDEIVAFADIGPAIDYPMRTYSSGMGGRLAFAVASHLDPEILLIDEALAAGDARFKDKCMARIEELCSGDRTVILVTHGLGIMQSIADQVLWIENGVVFDEGPAEEVIEAYLEHEEVSREAAMEDM